jgi:hypothetical protein
MVRASKQAWAKIDSANSEEEYRCAAMLFAKFSVSQYVLKSNSVDSPTK